MCVGDVMICMSLALGGGKDKGKSRKKKKKTLTTTTRTGATEVRWQLLNVANADDVRLNARSGR